MDVAARLPDYVEVFLGNLSVEFGLPFEDAIPRDQLDFSLESLRAVDSFLEVARSRQASASDQQMVNLTLAAGAYVGEVIRKNSSRAYRWLNYDQFFVDRPDLVGLFPKCLGTSAVLSYDPRGMTLPLNKVSRFLDEGPENSVHYYASCEVR